MKTYNEILTDDQMIENYKMKANALDGAKFTRVYHDMIFIWHGGDYINIYSLSDFVNLDCIGIAFHSPEFLSANLITVEDAINSRINDWENE